MRDSISIVRDFLVSSVSSGVSSTLSAGVDSDDQVWTLADGSGFPSVDLFPAVAESELVQGRVSGNVLTVMNGGRGSFGTSAVGHLSGVTVTQAVLFDVVGPRVSSEPPRNNDSARIWMQVSPEVPHVSAGVLEVTLLFRCFPGREGSGSFVDGRTVYRLLKDRLHGAGVVTVSSGTLMKARQTGGGQQLRDPSVDWPFVTAVYDVRVR